MKHRLAFAAFLALAFVAGAHALGASTKLPKCASINCRALGCPADVLCVSGAHVKTCADVCNGK
jgi:hypothetical protein